MINNPIKLNLKITNDITGGNPKKILTMIDNMNNSNIIPYQNNELSHNVSFEFNNNSNKKIYKNSQYLGKGGITAVYSIMLNSKNSILHDNKFIHLDKKHLILRIQDGRNFCFDEFIDDWKIHKKTFGENIIDVYFYGNIFNHLNEYIGKYIITRKYYDSNYIIKMLNYNQVLEYFNSLCEFLKKLKEQKYYYRDLKFSNIGMDVIDGKIIFIVLDYDNITLLNDNSLFLMRRENKYCNSYCSGTFMPYYMMFNFNNKYANWKNELDKMYIYGLIDIIICLFFVYDENYEEIINFIYLRYNDDVDEETNYNNFMINYNSKLFKIKMNIDKLTSQFKEITYHKSIEIKFILHNLLSKKYKSIYDIDFIQNKINEIDKNIDNNIDNKNNKNVHSIHNANADANTNSDNITVETANETINDMDEYKIKYIKYKLKYFNLIKSMIQYK
jgi:hypothetical protein